MAMLTMSVLSEVKCGCFYYKWPENHAMSTTTAHATVQQLCKIFSQFSVHRLPEQLIINNDPQFFAEDFKHFYQ